MSTFSQDQAIRCVRKSATNKEGRKPFYKSNIPEGWVTLNKYNESKKDKSNSAYGRSWFNDGRKNYFLKRDDPIIKELKLEKRRIL